MDIVFSIHQPMTSARAEQADKVYRRYEGKSGRTWYVAEVDNAGDYVYSENPNDRRGFGGATLAFPLVDGSNVEVVGPWHRDAGGFFEDTGVDVRDKYETQGVIALGRERGNDFLEYKYCDVIYYDERPVIGTYDRIESMAQREANERGATIYYAGRSCGGGYAGAKAPKAKEADHAAT